MDDQQKQIFGQLVAVITDEMNAQLGIGRSLEQIPVLIADALWDVFEVRLLPGSPLADKLAPPVL